MKVQKGKRIIYMCLFAMACVASSLGLLSLMVVESAQTNRVESTILSAALIVAMFATAYNYSNLVHKEKRGR